ncbi:MAG: hypothetical protein ACTSYA_02075 [Candidatus Kariarchaeaceae archaeon]
MAEEKVDEIEYDFNSLDSVTVHPLAEDINYGPWAQVQDFKKSTKEIAESLASYFGISVRDLSYFKELTMYTILDGHRSGVTQEMDLSFGYIEGAMFSIRLAKILKELGAKEQVTMIHTERNRKTGKRMKAIFAGIKEIASQFIASALENEIQLKYYGKNVHSTYELAKICNLAENVTKNGTFKLHYIMNYSEEWAQENKEKIQDIPEISTIIRFTKGHLGGVWLPNKANQSNFIYTQNASVSDNWSDEQLIAFCLIALKSHLDVKGVIGGRQYTADEREQIYQERELNLFKREVEVPKLGFLSKRSISFSSVGPLTYEY